MVKNNILIVLLTLGITIGLAIYSVHAPIGNTQIGVVIDKIVQYIGIVTIPLVVALWSRNKSIEDKEELRRKEEKEKEEEQQKEILNILLQYYKETILPYKIIIYEREVSIALIKTLIHKYFELDMRALPPYKLRTKTFLEKMEEIRIYFDTNKNNDDIQENTITLLLYLIDWTEPMLMNQDVFEKHSQFTTNLIGVFGIKK